MSAVPGRSFRRGSARRAGEAGEAGTHILYPSNRLTPAWGISETMPKMQRYTKRDCGPDCSATLTDVLDVVCEGTGQKKVRLAGECGVPALGLQAEGAGAVASLPGEVT